KQVLRFHFPALNCGLSPSLLPSPQPFLSFPLGEETRFKKMAKSGHSQRIDSIRLTLFICIYELINCTQVSLLNKLTSRLRESLSWVSISTFSKIEIFLTSRRVKSRIKKFKKRKSF